MTKYILLSLQILSHNSVFENKKSSIFLVSRSVLNINNYIIFTRSNDFYKRCFYNVSFAEGLIVTMFEL